MSEAITNGGAADQLKADQKMDADHGHPASLRSCVGCGDRACRRNSVFDAAQNSRHRLSHLQRRAERSAHDLGNLRRRESVSRARTDSTRIARVDCDSGRARHIFAVRVSCIKKTGNTSCSPRSCWRFCSIACLAASERNCTFVQRIRRALRLRDPFPARIMESGFVSGIGGEIQGGRRWPRRL